MSDKATTTESHDKSTYVYQCRNCGWIMAEVCYLTILADLGCGRCGKPLVYFRRIRMGDAPAWRRKVTVV
jgi:predicted nucleic acid-binding Zn ribbon protein